MEQLTVYGVEVDKLTRIHQRVFHGCEGHGETYRKAGHMAAACPLRIEKLFLHTGAGHNMG